MYYRRNDQKWWRGLAADASGNVGTATYQVTVPHDSDGTAAVDDGPAFTVGGCTP